MVWKTRALLVLLLAITTACAQQNVASLASVSTCSNTFIVANTTRIRLFEHASGSTSPTLVRDIHVPEGGVGSAYYLCERNEIVNDYAMRGRGQRLVERSDDGIEIRPLNGSMKRYPFNEEGVGGIHPYRNGVLFDTALLQKEPIDPSLGYLNRQEQFNDQPLTPGNYVLREKGLGTATHHIFNWMHFFDLDKRKVTQSYRGDGAATGWFDGDVVVYMTSAIASMDLISGRRTRIYEFPELAQPARLLDGMNMRGGAFVRANGEFYQISSTMPVKQGLDRLHRPSHRILVPSGFAPNKPNYCKCMAIYKLDRDSGKWREQLKFPNDDVTYAIDKGAHIYLFTRESGKVLRYDTQTNKLHEIPFDTGGRAVVTASYTAENFVLLLANRDGSLASNSHTSSLVVVSADFMQRSHPIELGYLASPRVTTQQHPRLEGDWRALNEIEAE